MARGGSNALGLGFVGCCKDLSFGVWAFWPICMGQTLFGCLLVSNQRSNALGLGYVGCCRIWVYC